MDWIFISQFHKNPPTFQLKREKHVQDKYNKNKSKSGYNTDLYNRLFKYDQDFVIVPNTYPYHFVDGTEHLIYWSKKIINYSQLEENIEKLCKEYIYFENLDQNKSIKDIHHAHIFIKK